MVTTHVAPLLRPIDALSARIALIDEASEHLDLQYYQWGADAVGFLLLGRLLAAADRGVTVRLLVDDLRLRSRTRDAATLSLHPEISVRFFNPWTKRSSAVAAGAELVRRFAKLDRRMHNKLMVADGERAIVGGRNIADAHYGLHRRYNLVDYDLLLTGGRTSDLTDLFDDYWSSPLAVSASSFDNAAAVDLASARSRIAEQNAKRSAALPPRLSSDTTWRDRLAAGTVAVEPDHLHIIADSPGPIADTQPTQVIKSLHEAVDGSQHDLVVVTPFFVPTDADVAWYGALVDRGVRIRLLTNSLASNSGTISNSGLDRKRKAVVQAGVELLELRSDAVDKPRWDTAPCVSGYLGLHAKLYAIDGERVFLGSINLDPRSKVINTEVGMLVRNEQLAVRIGAGIEALMMPENAWRVEVDGTDRLTWTNSAETTHRQPARGPAQRMVDKVFEILPLDRYV